MNVPESVPPATLGPVPRNVAIDARAKIMWGEPAEKVAAFLREKGIKEEDAISLLAEFVHEREEDIRDDGIKMFWLGLLFSAAPFACLALYWLTHMYSSKLLAAALVTGALGVWRATKGFAMMTKPSSVKGSLANRED